MSNDIAVSMQHIDVLFGRKQKAAALELLDAGQSREQILSETGVVLGVADASLDVPAGSISVLMGLSGSGKSSLLRCVNGLNTITRGVLEISTDEGPIDVAACKGSALRRLRRHNLAMVFQQFALLPWATVRENIGFGLSVRGESDAVIKQGVDHQLELVGLEDWADKPIHTLSGGMQQRVGLARAFATDADILLMDEPFSALDPLIREHLQDELLALQSRLKKTILFVSHDLDEALKLGNQISIMDGGRIVQTGSADEIVFKPQNDYVKRFVANINPLSVLTAAVIMQPVKTRGAQWLHETSGLLLHLHNDCLRRASMKGKELRLTSVAELTEPGGPEPSVACVSPGTPVKQLLKLATSTAAPVLVCSEDGALRGVITHQDLLQSLQD